MAEKWKQIEGYNNLYEISDEGRVRNKNNLFQKKILTDEEGTKFVFLPFGDKNVGSLRSIDSLIIRYFGKGKKKE